jgi:hypothetical protein
MATQALNLPASPHRKLYRALVAMLQANPILKAKVRSWVTYDGTPRDRLATTLTMCPAIRLVPFEGPDRARGPTGAVGDLVVMCDLAVAGTDADDLMDLYHVVRRTFHPEDQAAKVAVRTTLLDAGAEIGEVEFSQARLGVGVDDKGQAAFLVGSGQFRVALNTFNF